MSLKRHPETAKVDAFADLQEGWDSYGAAKPVQQAIEAAKRLFVSPSVHGGVEFEWDHGDECVLFTLGPDGSLEGVYFKAFAHEYEWEKLHASVSREISNATKEQT